jgi:hypothetical protein
MMRTLFVTDGICDVVNNWFPGPREMNGEIEYSLKRESVDENVANSFLRNVEWIGMKNVRESLENWSGRIDGDDGLKVWKFEGIG